jgi:hypothetical protein
LGYVVSQGVFWVASVSLVEHRYALRSERKLILEDSDQLQDKEKLIPGDAKRLPGKMDRLSGKIEPESKRTDTEPGKTELSSDKEKLVLGNTNQLSSNVDRLSRKADPGTEPGSGKAELGPDCEIGLREVKLTSVERFKEELVMKKDEVEKDGSFLDEGKTKPIAEGDSVKNSDTIRTD